MVFPFHSPHYHFGLCPGARALVRISFVSSLPNRKDNEFSLPERRAVNALARSAPHQTFTFEKFFGVRLDFVSLFVLLSLSSSARLSFLRLLLERSPLTLTK